MDIAIRPRLLRGDIEIIPSKSQAHRLLICAAFADRPTQLHCPETNRDIEATANCLQTLGADVLRTESGYTVFPISAVPEKAELNCCESGSTLRFFLPIVGALGVDATFLMEGRLPSRPLSPLWEEMERMGCTLTRPTANSIRCTGKLQSGEYTIDGGVSSQFITGLLFAHALIGNCTLTISGTLESKPYVDMTRAALSLFDAPLFHSPGYIRVEGDWSNGAFWVAAEALESPISITGLSDDSLQGDRAILDILHLLEQGNPTISVRDIPDLMPILSVVAAAKHGAVFTDIRRLRLKESDRVATTIAMLEALGGKAEANENTLTVYSTPLLGGTVDACNDHRIAMAAAIAATVCKDNVTILGAQCVEKSYPKFWEEYSRLGGNYELNLR
jgi:3-phosphoshikimate 1-carboxyvinyltransferase